jgi:two-component system cell cycle sensor histidine kinase/response regulator CckA
MLDLFQNLFDSRFMPHGFCYLWKPRLVWLHVISDALIAVSYYSIPLSLFYFVRKRRDLPFHWVFLMFAAFILGCGSTHAMEVWTIWHGTYWLSGVIKAVTAVLSAATAVGMVVMIPEALALPSPAQLRAANEKLQEEIRQRITAEQRVNQLNETLERRVEERTRELEQEAVRRQEADDRFRLAVEAAPNAIVMSRAGGEIVLINSQAERLLGYAREELIGKREEMLFPAGKESEALVVRKDGVEVPVEVRRNPIRAEDGEWVLTSIVDITERKRSEEERRRLEERMRHAQKLESLGVLAGGIAHDFNNLLVSILGNASLAALQLAPEAPARETVRAIEAAAIRSAELTKQLLAYSGRGKFVIEPLDLSQLVAEMSHILGVTIPKKATLRTRLAAGLPAVEADAGQIQQVVMNLITNAAEALGGNPGDIVVSTGEVEADRAYLADSFLDDHLPEGRYVYLEVTDSGCGMDKETQAKIFDPFFTTKFTGRGLGLAAVLGIVRGHGGAIRVYSEPGKGTAFKVLLPASGKVAPQRGDRSEATRKGSGTVLVVDDEAGVRDVASRMLEFAGYRVLTAENGVSGVEMFRAHASEISAVLLDLTMPDISGEEVFRAIRQIRGEAKVIVSTGYSEQETMSLFQGRGLAGFIQKPYEPAKLIEIVSRALEGGESA